MRDVVVDWELAMQLAGNSREHAEEMFVLLVKDLPSELANIKQAYSNNHFENLENRIHKLHGALCYCGAPRLKTATAALESAVRDKITHPQIPTLLAGFEREVNALITEITSLAL